MTKIKNSIINYNSRLTQTKEGSVALNTNHLKGEKNGKE
jgi:hypothetical protein